MVTVPTELPRVSDAAARHTVDAAKAFKEFLRVRDALKEFEGSMHWKKVDRYEYLVHKVKDGKLQYLGPRAPETEIKLDAFCTQKRKLEARFKVLRETVETSQRVNKAVRAGTVPPPVVEVLCALDEAGLGKSSLVVGSTALYAYGQRSGLRVDAIKAPGGKASVAEECQHHLLVLIDVTSVAALNKVRDAVKTATITPLPLHSCNKMVLDVHYGKVEKTAPSKPHGARVQWHIDSLTNWKPLLAQCEKGFAAAARDEEVLEVLDHAPKFEQVVIGRTGRMAMMRTLDPLVFVSLCKHRSQEADASPDDAERRELQVELVSRMLNDYLVTSKIAEGPGVIDFEQLWRQFGGEHPLREGSATPANRSLRHPPAV